MVLFMRKSKNKFILKDTYEMKTLVIKEFMIFLLSEKRNIWNTFRISELCASYHVRFGKDKKNMDFSIYRWVHEAMKS